MGGKSTLMRQVALLCIMAHMVLMLFLPFTSFYFFLLLFILIRPLYFILFKYKYKSMSLMFHLLSSFVFFRNLPLIYSISPSDHVLPYVYFLLFRAAQFRCSSSQGSYIPAKSCRLSAIDRIFTRLGASDNIMRGSCLEVYLISLS